MVNVSLGLERCRCHLLVAVARRITLDMLATAARALCTERLDLASGMIGLDKT